MKDQTRQEQELLDTEGVGYETRNHVQILFKLHGSVWRKVIVYCLINVGLTYSIIYSHNNLGLDLSLDKGHSYMTILISFLIVQRSQLVYGRYMEARALLGILFRSSTELMQLVSTMTIHDTSKDAKEWRRLVALEVMKLLNVTATFLSFRSGGKSVWDNHELDYEKKQELQKLVSKGYLDVENANAQAPILLLYNIRKLIAHYQRYIGHLDDKLEISLQSCVSDYSDAYYGLKRLIMVQFPFPLVQMARTFLFFYVFTLPFELVTNMNYVAWSDILTIFFLTYGYIGIELVSMEMDDPFGDDPNDFKHVRMKNATFEDIYFILNDANGVADARALRHASRTNGENFEQVFQGSKTVSKYRGHRRKPTEVDDIAMSKNLKSLLGPSTSVKGTKDNAILSINMEESDHSN